MREMIRRFDAKSTREVASGGHGDKSQEDGIYEEEDCRMVGLARTIPCEVDQNLHLLYIFIVATFQNN